MNLGDWIGDTYRKIKAYFIMLRHNITPPQTLDWVTPELAIGGDLRNLDFLKAQGIGAIIGLQAERSDDAGKIRRAEMEYLHIPIKDGHAPVQSQIQSMIDWINRERGIGRKVYMHCAAGVGRAPTMAIAYLVSTGLTTDQAVAEIKEKHHDTDPSPRQVDAVRQYEAELTTKDVQAMSGDEPHRSDMRT